MKKTNNLTFTIILFLILISNLKAQDYTNEIKTEITNNTIKLDSIIKGGDYYTALQIAENIRYSVRMLYGVYLDTHLFPYKLNEYKLDTNSKSVEIDDKGITLTREYAKQNSDSSLNKKCTITILISNKSKLTSNVINTLDANLIDEVDRKYKPMEIKGYKSLLVFDKSKKYSSLAIALSNVNIVEIDIIGHDDYTMVFEISKLFDFIKINELLH